MKKLTLDSVPPELLHLIPGFLERREKDVADLRFFLALGDYVAIKDIGHRLKGTGTGYGFSMISELGKDLEAAAALEDFLQVSTCIEQLKVLTGSLKYCLTSAA
ncbi:MAG: Hpt domain-containing protein [Pseudobdellovibrionaceae bacterium]